MDGSNDQPGCVAFIGSGAAVIGALTWGWALVDTRTPNDFGLGLLLSGLVVLGIGRLLQRRRRP